MIQVSYFQVSLFNVYNITYKSGPLLLHGDVVPLQAAVDVVGEVEAVCEVTMLGQVAEKIHAVPTTAEHVGMVCLLYTSPSPRDRQKSRMPSSA